MSRARQPLLMARESFRLRRLIDAARLLPVAGLCMVLLPVFWASPEDTKPATASEGVYLFAVWLGLILAAALLVRHLAGAMTSGEDSRGSGP